MSLMTALILCMSLIFPAWVVLLLRRKARTGLDTLDWTFIAAAALYVLPFLITASDPRYQIPLEICLLAHMAYMADQGKRNAARCFNRDSPPSSSSTQDVPRCSPAEPENPRAAPSPDVL
jgi:hypothetical protein